MSETVANSVPVTVRILDKEYRIACPEGEQDDLIRAAELLNQRMREMRDGSQIVGAERVSVLTALNLANDLLRVQNHRSGAAQGHWAASAGHARQARFRAGQLDPPGPSTASRANAKRHCSDPLPGLLLSECADLFPSCRHGSRIRTRRPLRCSLAGLQVTLTSLTATSGRCCSAGVHVRAMRGKPKGRVNLPT